MRVITTKILRKYKATLELKSIKVRIHQGANPYWAPGPYTGKGWRCNNYSSCGSRHSSAGDWRWLCPRLLLANLEIRVWKYVILGGNVGPL